MSVQLLPFVIASCTATKLPELRARLYTEGLCQPPGTFYIAHVTA
jgi:hypothetical protein